MHDLKTNPEKVAEPESDFGGETERDPEDNRAPIPGDKSADVTNVKDAGPPDDGAAAWLVVLGAWCCSFSSPGWVNSEYFLCFRCLPRFSLRTTQGEHDGLTRIIPHQV